MGVAAIVVTASASEKTEIVVTRESPSLPSGCTPREAAELIVRFTDAVNRGDAKALDRIFAIADQPGRPIEPAGLQFRWYSVTEGRMGETAWRHRAIYDRADLFEYFRERHRQHELLELVAVDVGLDSVSGGGGVAYTIRREADDLPSWLGRFARGKGGIDCASQRIYLWSMGQSDDDSVRTGCPVPTGWAPGVAIVACARSADPVARSGPTAPATVADFRVIGGGGIRGRCAPRAVAGSVRSTLLAFNGGLGAAFARQFTTRAAFSPRKTRLVGRSAIAAYARTRYEAGEGWTAAVVRAGRPRVGVYRLDLRISTPGGPLTPGVATITVACHSGLLRRWVGPAGPPP
jgi:hypothetical protein